VEGQYRHTIWRAVYHAISAFNNCGYSIFPDSLMSYRDHPGVNLTIMSLIIVGGIGFIVIHEILEHSRDPRKRLSVHTRIVVITTSVLIVAGAVLIYALERKFMLKGLGLESQVLVPSSIRHGEDVRLQHHRHRGTDQRISPGAPRPHVHRSLTGFHGGGIKTTSAAVLFLLLWNRLKGSTNVNVFNRTIPEETVTKTISIIFASRSRSCSSLHSFSSLRPRPCAGQDAPSFPGISL
jgi:trk system potassium uptake protein TrkH